MKAKKYTEWVCTQGIHQAHISDARILPNPYGRKIDDDMIRIIFKLTTQHPLKMFCAQKCYRSWEVDLFIQDFTNIVGEETVDQMFDFDSELIPESLSVLEGEKVDIEIVHRKNKRYADPYCIVSKVEPSEALFLCMGTVI